MIGRIKTSLEGGAGARGSKEPSTSFATIAFFLPLILAGAYLNMGQTCCNCPPTPVNFVVTGSTAGAIADDDSWDGVASSNGMLLMFTSQADNLGAPSDGALVDLFTHDVLAKETTWVGTASSSFSFSPALNATGDYAVFSVLNPAYSGYQVGGLSTSGSDQTIDWIFTNNSGSLDPEPTISGDGRFVAFTTNWAGPGDSNGLFDIYVRDRQTWELSRVGRPYGSQYNLLAGSPKLARDANRLVYELGDQWVHYTDWQCVFGCARETFAGTRPSISDDGTKVAYQASDGSYDGIFVFDETTDTHQRVSIDAYGSPASAECDYPVISGNGQFVAFRCTDAMTSHGGTNQVYVRDLDAGTTKLASITSTSVPSNQGAIPTSLSYGGVSLLLESSSTNLGTIAAGTRQVFRIPITYWREGSTCLPSSSVDTTCDLVDDDCNGQVDEDYVPIETTCGPGGCNAGITSCVAGLIVDSCDPSCGTGGTGGTGGSGTGGTGGTGTGGTGGSGTGGTGGTGTGGTGGGGGTQPGETVTYYDVDPLGSPVAATDSSANIVWRSGYEPFGHRLDESLGPDNALWFTGAAQEPVSQLIDLGSRQYNPEIGRFYGMDPVDFRENDPHSFNRYAYANNNPYKYVDPTGEIPLLATIAIGAGIGAVYGGLKALASGESIGNGITKGALVGGGIGGGAWIGFAVSASGVLALDLFAASYGGLSGAVYGTMAGWIVTEGIPDETPPNDAENAKRVDELFTNAKSGAILPVVSVGLGAYATSVGYGALEAGLVAEVGTNISGGAVGLLMSTTAAESSSTSMGGAGSPATNFVGADISNNTDPNWQLRRTGQ